MDLTPIEPEKSSPTPGKNPKKRLRQKEDSSELNDEYAPSQSPNMDSKHLEEGDQPVSISQPRSEASKKATKKAKLAEAPDSTQRADHPLAVHKMSPVELEKMRSALLDWYDENQRHMPWRKPSDKYKSVHWSELKEGEFYDEEKSQFSQEYGALVSELMLQQTQVATVRSYFEKWMKRFPTVEALASASLDEVNAVWAGLGYYRRAKLIHECAKAIVTTHGGKIPETAAELEKLPGLGRYTAGAISSVVFGEASPIVDGNVVRVLTRLRAIAGDAKSPKVIKALWELSSACVSPDRPGDFNQALMELGALVCTKANPSCTTCPLAAQCLALAETKSANWLEEEMESKRKCVDWNVDMEDLCNWCPATASNQTTATSASVTKYPVKGAKKAKKQLTTSVSVVRWTKTPQEDTKSSEEGVWYLFKRRPEGGLLGGFWEFPSVDEPINEGPQSTEGDQRADEPIKQLDRAAMDEYLLTVFGLLIPNDEKIQRKSLGTYLHKFTHIDQTVIIENLDLVGEELPSISESEILKWVSGDKLSELAISKVTSVCIERLNSPSPQASTKNGKAGASSKKGVTASSPKKKTIAASADKKQPSILSMFAAKSSKPKVKEESELKEE